ncbi:AfsR/SARP family transcriptional regulator [Kutzneria kofuensis]|uniref:DNA-binding SARP family transcriptional activator/tetratricopeptide (TPR) repeat protein n=1 Tax=Kutzneria kofuensis TaxID=103725 RepID=A0A7W9KN31_9PSEU|nr:BTAD domain-containing putative transcriptional regulator [Kutzneria kofuensis]MBB5895606.1 DNA-binding SARP family transcriptional activator/tetratricopeptide (TPR) repeat protein [Kutzneria kofuensis]
MGAEFRVLGELRATVDGRDVDLGPRRQRCVLAVLLVETGRGVSVDELIDRVWGTAAPQRAAGTLYSYLSRLRGALGGATLVNASDGYRLAIGPDDVDLHRFRRLIAEARASDRDEVAGELFRQALGLWQGQALSGLSSPWLDDMRSQLEQERLAARRDHVDIELRAGRHAELLSELTTEATRRPEDERLAGQLMLALYRSGRQADALRHYDLTRRWLAEEHGADPSPPLQEVYQRILTGDPRLAGTTAPVPRQLPAAPAWFTGRRRELAELDRAGAISVIAGTAGIGKTSLALHWAYQRLDRFPDGQLFVNLHGFAPGGEPVSPAGAIGALLDGLGVLVGARPVDLDAQIALYRSLVAGRRMLIVLDNAVDAAQVAPLLPDSPSGTVVITSRNRLSGLVKTPVPIEVLSEEESRDLLVRRLGTSRVAAEPDAVEELVAYCGGSPLALGIVAARAAVHPDFALAGLVAEFRDASTRLDALDEDHPMASLPAALSWSYNALTPEQAEMFALLGLAPGPDIGLPAAAALANRPAAALVRALERVSLVQQDKPGRYRMHDLVRLYARDRACHDLSSEQRTSALLRLTDHYLHSAYAGDRLMYPSRTPIELTEPVPGSRPHHHADVAGVVAWFDAEHSCVLATLRLAEEQGWHRLVWQLAWSLDTFHHHGGHVHDDLATWTAAARHVDDDLRGLTLRRLGTAYSRLGRHAEGMEHLLRSLALAEEAEDDAAQAHCHRALAAAAGLAGDNRSALDHAMSALRYYEKLDSPIQQANALNQVGWYAAQIGQYAMARSHCEAALAVLRDHPDPQGEADTLDSMGYICHHSGEHALALGYYRRALAQWRKVGAAALIAEVLERVGETHTALGDHEQARAAWRQAFEHYRSQNRPTDAARVERLL